MLILFTLFSGGVVLTLTLTLELTLTLTISTICNNIAFEFDVIVFIIAGILFIYSLYCFISLLKLIIIFDVIESVLPNPTSSAKHPPQNSVLRILLFKCVL